MFIGHFAVGFGAKKVAPGLSLGLLFIAAQFLDLLWPSLLMLDLEQVEISPGITKATPLDFTSYPISHSLLMVVIWSMVFSVIYWLIKRNIKYAIILALCVVSHWFLDLIVHRPDLPLTPGTTARWGLGLWNFPYLTLGIEILFFVICFMIYTRVTTAKNGVGRYGIYVLGGFLILIQFANLLGPPPPNVTAIAWGGQLQWLFVLLAFWIDKNRMSIQ